MKAPTPHHPQRWRFASPKDGWSAT